MLAYLSCRKRARVSVQEKGLRNWTDEGGNRQEMEKRYYFDGTNLAIY
jgi:hypothetical protein